MSTLVKSARLGELRKKLRTRRFQTFLDFAPTGRPLKIVDLGGTIPFWEDWWEVKAEHGFEITLINNHHIDLTAVDATTSQSFIQNKCQDVNDVTVSELSEYDLIFSNSFLEHLPSWKEQSRIAEKICASGKPFFIQVPNKNSIIDPHFASPFVPWFALYPKEIKARLATLHSFGSGRRAADISAARKQFFYYNPLGLSDLRRLFPDSHLQKERAFGIPLSIIARSQKSDLLS